MLCRDFCDVTGFSLSRDLLRFCLIYVTVCWSWVQSNNNNKLFSFFFSHSFLLFGIAICTY